MQVTSEHLLGRFLKQHWFLLALLLFFLGVSLQYSAKAVKGRGAFSRWQPQLQQLDEGENIVQRYNYPNPPIMAVLLKPLAELPPLAGALTWFYLKVGMALLSLWWVFRLVETADLPFPPWAKALTVLLSLRPIMGDLSHGNVNLFILFLLMAALYAFSRGRDVTAGLTLALAIACKITPALLVPYFLWKRSWKTLAGCAAGLVLFFWLVPALVLGPEKNTELLQSWVDQMARPYLVGGQVFYSEHNNQSLPGLLVRLLTDSPSFSVYVDDVYTPTAWHNLTSLPPSVVPWIVKGCMVLFAGFVVWLCRTPTSPRQGWQLAAEYAVILLGMLLFSERTWKHHCVTLLLPFAVLSYCLATARLEWRLRSCLIGTLTAVVLLMSATSTGLLPDDVAKLAQVYGAYVGAFLLLTAALFVLLHVGARQTGQSSAAPTSHGPAAPPLRIAS